MSVLRQSAFTGEHILLKGGLHSHTTRSDGELEAQHVIALHERKGYDFLAITDHRIYNFDNAITSSRLTILPGMEIDRDLDSPDDPGHGYHLVCLGPGRQDGNPYEQDQIFETAVVNSQVELQPLLDELNQNKQRLILCHPQWSCTPTRSFDKLNGYFALEIWNTGSAQDCMMDRNNEFIWDELLMQGKKIWGVAVDDGHKRRHHGKGYVMVNAENKLSSILQALENGAFYSSCGPVIHDFFVDEGRRAQLSCSGAVSIAFCYGGSPYRVVKNVNGPLFQAGSRIPESYRYVRAVVRDEKDRLAWTNPIFLD